MTAGIGRLDTANKLLIYIFKDFTENTQIYFLFAYSCTEYL